MPIFSFRPAGLLGLCLLVDACSTTTTTINKRGNRVVDNPDHAQYLLQANVLQAGKASPTAAEQAFGSGFGGGLFGAAVGATTTRAATKNSSIIVGGGLIGAATDVVTGSFGKDVT